MGLGSSAWGLSLGFRKFRISQIGFGFGVDGFGMQIEELFGEGARALWGFCRDKAAELRDWRWRLGKDLGALGQDLGLILTRLASDGISSSSKSIMT